MTLMGTYGGQRMITNLIDGVSISGVFLSSHLGPNELEVLRKGRIHYIVVDRRISTGRSRRSTTIRSGSTASPTTT